MLGLSDSAPKIRTRRAVEESLSLTGAELGVGYSQRASGDVHDARVALASVDGVDGVDGVAVPADVVAWVHARHVDHRAGQVEMWVELSTEFLSVARSGAVEPGVARAVELPVVGGEERFLVGLCGGVLGWLFGREEWSEQEVGCCSAEERVDEECALEWSCNQVSVLWSPSIDMTMRLTGTAQTQPSLKHPKHTTSTHALIFIRDNREPTARLPWVILLPLALPYGVVHVAFAVTIRLPSLARATVNMWAKGELCIAWHPHPESIGVDHGMAAGDQGVGVFRVPELHEESLGFDQVRVRAGLDL